MSLPNIIYIHSHDTGRYLQPYGYAIPTPNIQRLAEEGILFRQAFCAAPTCSPSRAALLTGQSPHSAGMTGLVNRGWGLNDNNQHIVNTLRQAGYTSALAGVQHLAKFPESIGYDQVLKTASRRVADVVPVAKAYLENAPATPFFLTIGFSEVHREFPEAGPSEDARYVRPPAPLPDTPETRADMATYLAGARVLDDGVGTILQTLDNSGLAENTLVISTTDHGVAFPGLKCNLTDHGIGVSLIMRGPHGFSGGKVVDALVSQIDIFPTLCELAGLESPSWLQGKSIMPLIRESVSDTNDAIFAEVSYHAAYEPKRAIRTKRYKYIRHYGDHHTSVLPNCDDSLSKDVWKAHGWHGKPVDRERLYDLIFDPNETQNLIDDPTVADVAADLRQRLDIWMTETNDPLFQGGFVPPTEGGQVNDSAGISPKEALPS
ncbi:MAG: sulfatase [Chloroflexota bacterium]